MGRRNKCKPRLIPQQDKRICCSICLCQFVVVISCVSLIYLTVAIYIPAYRTFNSGYEMTPVMCQTVNTSLINNCNWASCGEWCLTKASGFCPQIHVTARQNGTNLALLNCTQISSVACPDVNPHKLKKYNCNNGTECATLTGFFNCSKGHCRNMSAAYQCHYKTDGIFPVNSVLDNMKLNGFFECKNSKCIKVKRSFHCDRYCDSINTTSSNVYVDIFDTIYLANCKKIAATNMANGNQPGTVIERTEVWRKASTNDVLMMSCHKIRVEGDSLNLTDCINGTIFNSNVIPKPSTNFTTFWNLTGKHRKLIDPSQRFLPMQSNITIYNHSFLYINLEGCVNTLRGECMEFLLTHGRDGRNQTARSRFSCFYKKNDSFKVLWRHNLAKTWNDFVIAASVPSVAFVVSFISLCTIMKMVKVGDDTKMRCKYCVSHTDSELCEMIETNNKYDISSPSDDPSKRDEMPLVGS